MESVERIVNQYLDMVLRIAFQHCFNKADSEDIAQEVFVKLMQNLDKIQSEEHLKAWLIRVTINKSKDYNKNMWNTRIDELNPNMQTQDNFAGNEIYEMVKELKPDMRDVVYLHYYEGYKIKEIAQILKKNENTVSSLLRRAKIALKQNLYEEV